MIKALENRITKTPYMLKNSLARSFSIVTPEFVYYYLNQLVTFGFAYLIGTGQYGTEVSEKFSNNSTMWAVLIRITALIIATLPLLWSFAKEYPRILPSPYKRVLRISYVTILAISSSILVNVIAQASGFTKTSESFAKTASTQFSLPLWLGILVYGIVTPVTEEIVHRGIIYNRLRRYFNLPIAVIAGSLLFGISHGNLVQLVYATLMGIFICCVYERYGSFLYPVLFHCISNTAVYIFMSIPLLRSAVFSVFGIVLEALFTIASLYLIFSEKTIDT